MRTIDAFARVTLVVAGGLLALVGQLPFQHGAAEFAFLAQVLIVVASSAAGLVLIVWVLLLIGSLLDAYER